jgi:hypothetical protein
MTDQPDPGDRDRWARLHFAARNERRNDEAVHGSAVWRLELHAGSSTVLMAHGTCATALAVVVDDHSRLAHVQCSFDEKVDGLALGFSRAVMRCGMPRVVETDNTARSKRWPRRSTPK